MQNGVYVRLGSSNRKADFQLISELQRGVAGISFDTLPMPQLTIADIDIDAVKSDFSARKIDEQSLLSLKILVRNRAALFPAMAEFFFTAKTGSFIFRVAGYNVAVSSAKTRVIFLITPRYMSRCRKPSRA